MPRVRGRTVHRSRLLVSLFIPTAAFAQSYSPSVDYPYPTTVYWGDTHLHTELSVDAYGFGNRIGSVDAYRFAKGEVVVAANGMRARLRRPLDFLVIADHAESIGTMVGLAANDPMLLETEAGQYLARRYGDTARANPTDRKTLEGMLDVMRDVLVPRNARGQVGGRYLRSVWAQVASTADHYNDPGRFTAFIGFEWTSWGDAKTNGNLHRVVIFKDGADRADRVLPFSNMDSMDPEALWNYMAAYERQTGGEVLAIPHNGNLSNGGMFALERFGGAPLTKDYAERRSRWEPLYEVTQIKGTSEAHPFLSPTDEFANFEIWNSWLSQELPPGRSWDESERRIKEGEYVRSALKRGLNVQATLGTNPFKLGMVGGTDAHTSLAGVEEDNFWGKAPLSNPSRDRVRREKLTPALPVEIVPHDVSRAWQMGASGYTGIWATANTREALFTAMKRRETYATTGPRIAVRFFGGWSYAADDARRPDSSLIGYRKGVPMGGDLTVPPAGHSPSFLVCATKDPDGANLDRIQMIKGWVDAAGMTHEKIYDIALSDGRRETMHGNVPTVGLTVDVNDASYINSIGAPELSVVWTDPAFNPDELAFYYVRVLEIPTPRWTAFDAKFFGVKDVPAQVPMVIQERAITSAIWYTPQGRSASAHL